MTKLTAKDLMVGDYVQFPKTNHIFKVQTISGGEQDTLHYVTAKNGNGDFLSRSEWEGVPLTAEILEKNGVVYAYDRDVCVADYTYKKVKGYQYNDENVLIDYFNGYIRLMNGIPAAAVYMNINYVHELQNALKLCGIKKEIVL